MYETITYETILRRLLERVPASMDKREGSIIYDALAPVAAEVCQMYLELDVVLNETFADTAHRQNLIKRASERGLTPYPATFAVAKGVFNIDVPIGSRYSINIYNYVVTKALSAVEHSYEMVCESAGKAPNGYTGKLIPIDYIQGLTSAELTEILIPGEDEEDTESFRMRYLENLSSQAYGGNVADYKEKTKALAGVGGVKVYPVWNGGGTVKVVITASDGKNPTEALINEVQTALDPVENHGEGLGLAPIGHVVTVAGATGQTVNISMQVTYKTGWNFTEAKPYLEEVLDDYFAELNKHWEEGNIIVRTSQIESRILNLEGVLDVSHTKLNNVEENLTLDSDKVAVRGEVIG